MVRVKWLLFRELSLGGFGLQRFLGDLDQLTKGRLIGGGDVREDLAIQFDLGRLQPFDKTAVGDSVGPSGGIDADLP